MTTNSIAIKPGDAGTETKEALMLMRYSEYRASAPQGSELVDSETPFTLENCS